MSPITGSSFVRPTLDTPFHIDFNWWKENDNNWTVYLTNYLCPEHQEFYEDHDANAQIDLIDPVTAEVKTVEGLLYILESHCALQPDFLSEFNTLVDSVFKFFLLNGNKPLTPVQLGDALKRSPDIILRTLAGSKVYRGIKPIL